MASTITTGKAPKLDPATFAVLVGRVDSIVNATVEIEMTIARSLLVAECRDATSFVSDKHCRLVSIAEGLPSHCAAGEFCIKSIADAFEGDVHEGDLFIFNAPYMGNTHVGDINIAAPVFFEGEHLFWMVNRSHLPDIGAYQPTSCSLYFKDKWEEGFHITPLRIHENYKEKKDLLTFFKTNFRYPHLWYGDHLAQVAAVRTGEKKFIELCKNYGKATIVQFLEEYNDYADRMMTEEIRKLPKGTWEADELHDPVAQGVAPDGIKVKVKLTIDPEAAMIHCDLRESADIVPGGVNTTIAGASASCIAALMQCLNPNIPKINGALKHLNIIVRPGSTAGGPIFPASTSMGTTSIPDRLGSAVYRAFALAVPERSHSAAGYITIPATVGVDFRHNNRPYGDIAYLGVGGGPASKGYDGWASFFDISTSGVIGLSSVEIMERQMPHHYSAVMTLPDSAGPGQWRGGIGAGYEYHGRNTDVFHVCMGDGQVSPPFGIFGGKPAPLAKQYIVDMKTGQKVQDIPSSGNFNLPQGHEWHLYCQGGGGYGDPLERDPELVRWDAREGLVSLRAVKEDYGVVLDTEPETYAVDLKATQQLRRQLKAQRNQ
jgi:N-methylhydantoinase B